MSKQFARVCRGSKKYFISFDPATATIERLQEQIALIEKCDKGIVKVYTQGQEVSPTTLLIIAATEELVATVGVDEKPIVLEPQPRPAERVQLPESLLEYMEEMKLV